MRESRSIIGNKGLITLPKEWRESHGIVDKTEGGIETVYKESGALIIIPSGKTLSPLETACIDFLEKGPSVDSVKEQLEAIKRIYEAFTVTLSELEEG